MKKKSDVKVIFFILLYRLYILHITLYKMSAKFYGRIIQSKQDDYNTPLEGWKDILQYIPKDTELWLPFYNDGSAKDVLGDLGYKNVYHEKRNFYDYDHDGLVIDNPPYYDKVKIIKKLYERGKPFSLLLPMETIERQYFSKYTKDFQLIIPVKRYNYVESGTKTSPFKSCWFCWRMQKYLKTNDNLIFLKKKKSEHSIEKNNK